MIRYTKTHEEQVVEPEEEGGEPTVELIGLDEPVVLEVPHELYGYDSDPLWEREVIDENAPAPEDGLKAVTVVVLDEIIDRYELEIDKKLSKGPKAAAVLTAVHAKPVADDNAGSGNGSED